MLLGWVGFTATYGSAASSTVIVPGKRKPSSQVPAALGREISISGPSETWAPPGMATSPVSTIPESRAHDRLNVWCRVTDRLDCLANSSSLRFIASLWLLSASSLSADYTQAFFWVVN